MTDSNSLPFLWLGLGSRKREREKSANVLSFEIIAPFRLVAKSTTTNLCRRQFCPGSQVYKQGMTLLSSLPLSSTCGTCEFFASTINGSTSLSFFLSIWPVNQIGGSTRAPYTLFEKDISVWLGWETQKNSLSFPLHPWELKVSDWFRTICPQFLPLQSIAQFSPRD